MSASLQGVVSENPKKLGGPQTGKLFEIVVAFEALKKAGCGDCHGFGKLSRKQASSRADLELLLVAMASESFQGSKPLPLGRSSRAEDASSCYGFGKLSRKQEVLLAIVSRIISNAATASKNFQGSKYAQ